MCPSHPTARVPLPPQAASRWTTRPRWQRRAQTRWWCASGFLGQLTGRASAAAATHLPTAAPAPPPCAGGHHRVCGQGAPRGGGSGAGGADFWRAGQVAQGGVTRAHVLEAPLLLLATSLPTSAFKIAKCASEGSMVTLLPGGSPPPVSPAAAGAGPTLRLALHGRRAGDLWVHRHGRSTIPGPVVEAHARHADS